jgi:hypothetical protein
MRARNTFWHRLRAASNAATLSSASDAGAYMYTPAPPRPKRALSRFDNDRRPAGLVSDSLTYSDLLLIPYSELASGAYVDEQGHHNHSENIWDQTGRRKAGGR